MRQHDFRTTGQVPTFERVAQRVLRHSVAASLLRWDGDALRDGRAVITPLPIQKT